MPDSTTFTLHPSVEPSNRTPSQRLIDKNQLAQSLGVSVRTVDNLVKDRELPPGVRLGRSLFWCSSVIEGWFRQRFAAQRVWQRGGAATSLPSTKQVDTHLRIAAKNSSIKK